MFCVEESHGDTEIKVGSTKQEVLSSYQNVEVSPHPYISPMGEYLKIVLPNGNGIIVETNSAIVTRFRIGSFPAVEYIEGCL